MTNKQIGLAGLAVAVVVGLITVFAWWFPVGSDEGDQVNIDSGGYVAVSPSIGANGCVVIQGDCIVSADGDSAVAKEKIETLPSASLPPEGDGPWMFMVYGTGELGLYVRDGFTEDDSRLPENPTIAETKGVYAECRVDDGWIADPSVADIGRWYKVGYPEPSDTGDFWVFGGYLLPVGHNGEVPLCTDTQRQ